MLTTDARRPERDITDDTNIVATNREAYSSTGANVDRPRLSFRLTTLMDRVLDGRDMGAEVEFEEWFLLRILQARVLSLYLNRKYSRDPAFSSGRVAEIWDYSSEYSGF